MGFEQLPHAINEGEGLEPITSEDIEALEAQESAEEEEAADRAALKLVLQNIELGEAYMGSKRIPEEINRIEDLYRAWVAPRNWPNSNQPRAHLGMPEILEAVENVISNVHMAFWSDPQPFLLEAKGKTKPEAARAMAKVLKWALKMAGAKEEMRKALKSTLTFQQGVVRWNWQNRSHERVQYRQDAKGRVTRYPEKCDLSIPCLDFWELRRVFVDPGLRNHDIRNANWVAVQWFTNAEGLEELKAAGYKNIPDDMDELAVILADQGDEATIDSATSTKIQTWREYQAQLETMKSSADPMQQGLEILELTTNDSVYAVLQRKICIRRDKNPFGRLNFNSSAFIDVLGSWYGFGIGKLLEGDQRFVTAVVNAWIDSLSLAMQPAFSRKGGMGAQSQNAILSPGRVLNNEGELVQIEINAHSAEALNAVSVTEQRAMRRVGANSGSEMPTQAMRTSEGVQQFTGGVALRLQYFVEVWADLVFIPVLEAFLQLCKDNLQPDDINRILSEEEGKEYEGTVLDIYNGTYSLDVLSSTKLAAKRAMAALVPSIMQMLMADPVQTSMAASGKKIDWVQFVETVGDLTGYPLDQIVVDATPEDIKRYMQMQPGVMAAQQQAQVATQKHQNDLENINEKGTVQAGVAVVKEAVKAHLQSAMGGAPAALESNLVQPPASQQPQQPAPDQQGQQGTAPQGQLGTPEGL